MTTDLAYISATEALARFKDRSLSPVELMEAVIARAEAVDPKLNAFTYKHYDEALSLARKAEAKYMRDGARIRALEGLPLAIKDESAVKGKPMSNGSIAMKGTVADYTSPINGRLLRAGAILHARTATPEFSCAGYCHSKLNGITRNPWNTDYTPGGSSGGSGAALAAGMTTLATGSDIGGSIRIPAGCSGVVGFKPPYGRNPEDTPFNLDSYCHVGPLARNVADTIAMQNIIAGPHPDDIASLKPKLRLPTSYKPISGWKIAYSMDLGFYEVDPAVRENTLKALEHFRELGAEVNEVEIPWGWDTVQASIDYLEHLFGTSIAYYLENHAADLTDYARIFAEKGQNSTSTKFLKSLEKATEMYSSFTRATKGHSLFICPTNALPAVPADFNQVRDICKINGVEVNPMLGWVMTSPFNMLSRCPVLSVPTGHAPNGVPTGIQLIGQTYRDIDVFRAATAYEGAVGTDYDKAETRPML